MTAPSRTSISGSQRSPVLGLSTYWFFVMGALGVFFPYFTLYLKENLGLGGSQVGIVFATVPFIGIFAQPLWGQIADRTGSRTRLLALLAICSMFGYVGLIFPQSFVGMIIASALLAVFTTSLVPMGISVSMAILSGKGVPNFGGVRVWGSIGYLLAVVGTPPLLGYLQVTGGWQQVPDGPSEPGLEYIFLFAGVLVAGASLVARRLPTKGSVSARAAPGDYRILLRHGPFLRVLAFVFGMFFFIHGPMVVFPIFIRSLGGTMESVSYMWIWMIVLEIPLVASTHKIYRRIGPRWMVGLAALAAGARWIICAFTSSLSIIYPAQLFHGVVIAGLLVAAPLYVEGLVPARLRSTSQGLLTMVGPITAGILSTSLSGFLLEYFGPSAPYLFGGIGALAMCAIAPILLPRIEKQQ